MINNYVKSARGELFFFDDASTAETSAALAAVRAASVGRRAPAVWRALSPMPDDLRCIGHSPERLGANEWRCLHCGQRVTSDS